MNLLKRSNQSAGRDTYFCMIHVGSRGRACKRPNCSFEPRVGFERSRGNTGRLVSNVSRHLVNATKQHIGVANCINSVVSCP